MYISKKFAASIGVLSIVAFSGLSVTVSSAALADTSTSISIPDAEGSVPNPPIPEQCSGGNFAFIVDQSGSMDGTDSKTQSRFYRAEDSVVELAKSLAPLKANIGLFAFDGTQYPDLQQIKTTDESAIKNGFEKLKSNGGSASSPNVGMQSLLDSGKKYNVVFFVSDANITYDQAKLDDIKRAGSHISLLLFNGSSDIPAAALKMVDKPDIYTEGSSSASIGSKLVTLFSQSCKVTDIIKYMDGDVEVTQSTHKTKKGTNLPITVPQGKNGIVYSLKDPNQKITSNGTTHIVPLLKKIPKTVLNFTHLGKVVGSQEYTGPNGKNLIYNVPVCKMPDADTKADPKTDPKVNPVPKTDPKVDPKKPTPAPAPKTDPKTDPEDNPSPKTDPKATHSATVNDASSAPTIQPAPKADPKKPEPKTDPKTDPKADPKTPAPKTDPSTKSQTDPSTKSPELHTPKGIVIPEGGCVYFVKDGSSSLVADGKVHDIPLVKAINATKINMGPTLIKYTYEDKQVGDIQTFRDPKGTKLMYEIPECTVEDGCSYTVKDGSSFVLADGTLHVVPLDLHKKILPETGEDGSPLPLGLTMLVAGLGTAAVLKRKKFLVR